MFLWRRMFRSGLLLTMLVAFAAIGFAQTEAAPQAANGTPAPNAGAEKPAQPEGQDQGARGVHSDSTYIIGTDDLLAINVWKEPEISRTVPVRSDGKISLPLVGELTAGGETPLQLEQEITKKLESYISEPEVTVIVQDSKSRKINILGMVARPGSYLLTGSTTVLDAIAMAGGFKDFAKRKSIYVLRPGDSGKEQRLPFNYKDVIQGKNPEQNIHLQPRDTVVVP